MGRGSTRCILASVGVVKVVAELAPGSVKVWCTRGNMCMASCVACKSVV